MDVAVIVFFFDFTVLRVPAGLHTELRHCGAGIYLYHFGIDAIAGQGVFDELLAFLVIGLAEGDFRGKIKDIGCRQLPSVYQLSLWILSELFPDFPGDLFYIPGCSNWIFFAPGRSAAALDARSSSFLRAPDTSGASGSSSISLGSGGFSSL